MNVELETAYIGIGCTDPAAVATYLRDSVGLMPGETAPGAASSWRVDSKAQRVWLQPAQTDDAVSIGFEAKDDAAYERVLARLRPAEASVRELSPAELALRRVRRGVTMSTPWGVTLDLVQGPEQALTPFASPHFPQGLVTHEQGFGHFVFVVGSADAYEASRRFAIDLLGMKLSDTLRLPRGPVEMNVSFLHCNPRHHSLALAFVPMPQVPQRLHHVNFEVTDVRDVGAAFERAVTAGTPIANTMGQHANDQMVSFYSVSPGGWRVEIGATGRTVGDDWTDVREYDRISEWGHQPPDVLRQMLDGVATPARAPEVQ
jgi:2,3-dihydroxybiphenyl 1,2-dioxygenase